MMRWLSTIVELISPRPHHTTYSLSIKSYMSVMAIHKLAIFQAISTILVSDTYHASIQICPVELSP